MRRSCRFKDVVAGVELLECPGGGFPPPGLRKKIGKN